MSISSKKNNITPKNIVLGNFNIHFFIYLLWISFSSIYYNNKSTLISYIKYIIKYWYFYIFFYHSNFYIINKIIITCCALFIVNVDQN